jgi:MFS transporter, ACS family, hexuronate transporter
MQIRWYYVGMVAAAIAISYFDRQTLPVAIASIERNIPVSDQQFAYLQTAFLLSYAALYMLGGRILDWLGTRVGFLLIMTWWSLACALHSLASGFGLLMAARLLLGVGEGGAFPAASRVVAEWIGPEQRSTAMGIINAGTAVGSVLAPPVIGLILLRSGWRAMFLVAGGAGLLWVLWWWAGYRSNTQTISSGTLDARLLGRQMGWREVVAMKNVRVFVFAKFMSDSAWYFLLFWLPKYLYDARGFDIKQVSYYAWIPYAASGIGSFLGGWASSRLLRAGRSLDFSRKASIRVLCVGDAGGDAGFDGSSESSAVVVQHCVLLSAGMVGVDYDAAHGCFSAYAGGYGGWSHRLWRCDGWGCLWTSRGVSAWEGIYLCDIVCIGRFVSSCRISCHSFVCGQDTT